MLASVAFASSMVDLIAVVITFFQPSVAFLWTWPTSVALAKLWPSGGPGLLLWRLPSCGLAVDLAYFCGTGQAVAFMWTWPTSVALA